MIERVDVAGAFGKPGLDLDRSLTQGLLVKIYLVGRVLGLVNDLIVVLLGCGVEDRWWLIHGLLVWAFDLESVCLVDGALLGHGGFVILDLDPFLPWAGPQRLFQHLHTFASALASRCRLG